MIIDAHVHVGSASTHYIGYAVDEILRVADRAGFDKIFGTDVVALHYDMREGNRQLGEALKRYPDRIIGYITITSPYYGQAALDEMQRCYEVYGMKGLKMVHRTGGLGSYQLLTRLDEPAMYPIIEKAAQLRLPILLHATPEECENLSRQVPEAMIIMAHTGGCPTALGDWHKAIEAAKRFPNIYLDTASSQVDMGYIEAAVEAIGAERVIFGTDMPLLDPFTQLAKVTAADLRPEEKTLILGGNIARMLGLQT